MIYDAGTDLLIKSFEDKGEYLKERIQEFNSMIEIYNSLLEENNNILRELYAERISRRGKISC